MPNVQVCQDEPVSRLDLLEVSAEVKDTHVTRLSACQRQLFTCCHRRGFDSMKQKAYGQTA